MSAQCASIVMIFNQWGISKGPPLQPLRRYGNNYSLLVPLPMTAHPEPVKTEAGRIMGVLSQTAGKELIVENAGKTIPYLASDLTVDSEGTPSLRRKAPVRVVSAGAANRPSLNFFQEHSWERKSFFKGQFFQILLAGATCMLPCRAPLIEPAPHMQPAPVVQG